MNDFDKKRLMTLLDNQRDENVRGYVLITISRDDYCGSFPLTEPLGFEERKEDPATEILLVTYKEVYEKYSEEYDLVGIDFSTMGPRPVLKERK